MSELDGMDPRELREVVRAAKDRKFIKLWVKIIGGTILGIIALIMIFSVVSPQIKLYKKNTEKQAVIAEQKAKSQAAEYEARSQVTQAKAKRDAEIIRAEGVAEANKIISASIDENYLRYRYIENLGGNGETVIYVPTEGLIPITEAGRATSTTTPQVQEDGN